MAARWPTSPAVTLRISPVKRCSSSSLPPATRLNSRITPAAATTKVIPMIASWGTLCFRLARDQLKNAAPRKVTPSEIQNVMGSVKWWPSRRAMQVPNVATWASAKSTKITSRSTTCNPR